MTKEQDRRSLYTRRQLLVRAGAVCVAGAGFTAAKIAEGFLSRVGENVYNSIFPQMTQDEVDMKLLSSLFDVRQLAPRIYPGDGNIRGKAVGVNDVSPYLRFSSATLLDFISNTLHIDRAVFDDNGGPSFKYDPAEQGIFLGSPVANPISHYLMGYMPIGPDAISVPQVDFSNVKTRWSFLFGESEFGVYNGQREVAGRYSKGTSDLVYRPIYKLIDKHEGRVETPSLSRGMLVHEWLTIIRILDNNKSKTVIAGMHGCGTESFFVDFPHNIERLLDLTGSLNEYQVVVPVELDHGTGLDGTRRTTGRIDWKRARLQSIG